jgi:hypothetical protein
MLQRYRLPLALALVLALGAGSLTPAAARPIRTIPHAKPPAGIQGFLADLWQEVTRRLEKSGSGIDPFGQPTPPVGTTSSGDSGSGIDPFGGK